MGIPGGLPPPPPKAGVKLLRVVLRSDWPHAPGMGGAGEGSSTLGQVVVDIEVVALELRLPLPPLLMQNAPFELVLCWLRLFMPRVVVTEASPDTAGPDGLYIPGLGKAEEALLPLSQVGVGVAALSPSLVLHKTLLEEVVRC